MLICLFLMCNPATTEAADAVKQGIYRPSETGSERLALWDGQVVQAQWESELSHRNAKLRSVNNENNVYQLDLELPFAELGQRQRYLVADDVAVSVTFSGKFDQDNEADVWHKWYNQLTVNTDQQRTLQKLKAGLSAKQTDRSHPRHAILASWTSTEGVFSIGKPVVLQMTLTNVGKQPISFYDGGSQRGARNNQFDFVCRSGRGKALQDVGDPMNFGGISQKITLQPNESLRKTVDITKWFRFQEPGTCQITGLFHLEFQPSDSDDWRVLWEDFVVGQCTVKIDQPSAKPDNPVAKQ